MKKDIFKSKKLNKKVIIALVTSVVAVSAIGIGLGVGLSGGGGDEKSQVPTISTLSDLKNTLENISNDPIEVEFYSIAFDDWSDINDDFFIKKIKKPIIKIPSEFEAQYRIPNSLNYDGDLVVDFRIRKKGDVSWTSVNSYIVSVTGITRYKMIADFDAFGEKKILERNSENGLLEVEESVWTDRNNKYFTSPYSEQVPYMTSIKILPIEGPPIKKDGKATIEFEVTVNNNQKVIISYEFKVGQDTWNAKETLENMNTDPIYKENGIASTDWKNLDDDFFSTIIEKEKPNLPTNSDIQYRISDAISSNGNLEAGNLVVDFRYRRKDINNDEWTDISSQYTLNIFLDKDLADTQTSLKGLSKDDITSLEDINAVSAWTPITDEVYSDIMKVSPPSIPTNVEVQYQIPNAVTQDGELVVNLRYKKTDSSNWYTITHTVKVVGLNIEKAKTYINSLQLKDEQYFFDNTNSEVFSTFETSIILTKENANLIFNFPEGEEYQEPTIPNLLIYLLVEDLNPATGEWVKLSFHFEYKELVDNIIFDLRA